MLANRTSTRPPELADFRAPPVAEVVVGVQFNSLEGFLSPHLGLVWERFKHDFPNIEERPPLAPTFETFGPQPQFFPAISMHIPFGADMPRVLFINKDRTQLLQVQKDRFLHNWRKVESGGDYPRFERMLEVFEQGFNTFAGAIAKENIGAIVPNQCEVSYINQILVPSGADLYSVFGKVFAQPAEKMILDDLGAPEDLRFLLRYVIRDDARTPIGRVIASAEPALRTDGVMIIQLTMTARGKPATSDMAGVVEFLERGRLHLIRAFVKLTSPKMQEEWGRTQ
jgi:uncharacterized protein (TIGR04255 family)